MIRLRTGADKVSRRTRLAIFRVGLNIVATGMGALTLDKRWLLHQCRRADQTRVAGRSDRN